MKHLLSQTALIKGIDRLAQIDRDVARALARVGYPAPRQREPGFATLLRIMVAQQLSTKSAAAIWSRLEAACGSVVTAQRFLELEEAALKAIGFSRQKMAYGRSLAEALARGELDLEALATVPEQDAIARVSALRGFGRWSAEIYLLFALGRPDIFPADDLGLQVGMQRLKGLAARPRAKRWISWRSRGGRCAAAAPSSSGTTTARPPSMRAAPDRLSPGDEGASDRHSLGDEGRVDRLTWSQGPR